MKKFAFAAVLAAAAVLAPVAQAAAPAAPSDAAIRELMDATNARANIAASMLNMAKAVPQMLRMRAEASLRNNPKLNDEQRKAEMANVDRRIPNIANALQKDLGDPKLVDQLYNQLIPLYARHFTAEDVKALTDFYRSPVGKKSLQVMPLLMGENAQAAQKLIQERVTRTIEQNK